MEEDEDFEDYLLDLNGNKCLEKPEEATVVIQIISRFFTGEISQLSAELYTALALDEQNGIVSFIRNMAVSATHQSALTHAFELLEFITVKFRQFTESYFPNLIKLSLYVLHTEAPAKTKENALKVAIAVIETSVNSDLEISNLIGTVKQLMAKDKKIKPSVVEKIYGLLGKIFERHPESARTEQAWFLNKLMSSFQYQVKTAKHCSDATINGCFRGFDGLLTNFSLSEETLASIYDYIKAFVSVRDEGKQHVTQRSALRVFERHSRKFARRIYVDHEFWQENLQAWIRRSGDDQRSGFDAMIAFYREIAWVLEKESPKNGKEVFKTYLNHFAEKIRNHSHNSFEARAALMGIGDLSSSQPMYGTETDVIVIFELIMKHAQNARPKADSLYFPVYLECISKYISQSKSIKIEELNYLRRLSVMLIEQYPTIDANFQPFSRTALERSFFSLMNCGLHVLNNHINEVIYQGLIRSCAHPIWVDVELQKETGFNVSSLISYKAYLTLWQHLLNMSSSQEMVGVPLAEKKGVSVKVFDGYIIAFLKVISKLDLDVDQKVPDLSDPEFALEAKKPEDFKIFINIVDLYQDVIPTKDSSLISKWLTKIFQEMVDLSYKNPLVSGFYKVISTSLEADESYFDDCTGNEKRDCCRLLTKFLEDVLTKVDQYKGDLQIACLQALLSAPVCLIEPFIERTVSAFQVILRVGRGYFPLLKKGIATLEKWNAHLQPSTMKPLLQKILPHFDLFLQSHKFRDSKFDKAFDEKSPVLKSRGKIKQSNIVYSDSELLLLQRKFLLFLGKLDPDLSLALIHQEVAQTEEADVIRERLVYKLHFRDIKPQIHLDDLLPRIIDLSLSCSDRSTRITACEMLHAMVLLTLGNMKQVTPGQFNRQFRRLLQTCLSLGCDADHVVQQLFSPLLMQITHYFSSKIQLESDYTATLIDVLMEGVAHPYDSAVRDFSARAVKEFIVWSIKHFTPEELKKCPQNIRAILRKIYTLSLHPSYSKRLGAAVAFNHIYSVIREEKSVLETYWFELYYYFMESLNMSDSIEDKTQTLNALQHIKRPLAEKSAAFNVDFPDRKIPPCFEGKELCHLVKWTFKQCVVKNAVTRTVAMNLVVELAPKVKNCLSLQNFVEQYLTEDILKVRSPALNIETLNVKSYLAKNQAVFDYHNWLLRQNAISGENIKIKDVMKRFVHEISSDDANRFHSCAVTSSKCSGIILLLELLSATIAQCDESRQDWIDLETWDLISACLFRPSKFGFEIHDRGNYDRLPVVLGELLRHFRAKLKPEEWNYFYECFDSFVNLPKLALIVQEREPVKCEFFTGLKLLRKAGLWECLLEKTSFKMNGNEILDEVFNSLFSRRGKTDYALGVDPTVKTYVEDMLAFAFDIGIDIANVFQCIGNRDLITDEETFNKTTKGEYFLLVCKKCLYDFFISHPTETIDVIINQVCNRQLELLISLLHFVYTEGHKKAFENVVREIYRRWLDFQNLELKGVTRSEKRKLLFALIKIAAPLTPAPLGCLKREELVTSWVYDVLKNPRIELWEIESVFSLLQHLSNFCEDLHDNQQLYLSLSSFWKSHKFFNSDVAPQSVEFGTLTQMYRELFYSLKRTGSLVILKFILKIMPRHEKYLDEELMEDALTSFALQMGPEHVKKALRFLYQICFESDQDCKTRLISSRFLNCMLKFSTNAAVETFVRETLSDTCGVIALDFAETKVYECEVELARKITAATLLQTIHFKLVKEDLELITRDFPDRKDCLRRVIDVFSDVKDRPKNSSPEILELHRQFVCICFNSLCTVITARSNDPRVFAAFIFRKDNRAMWKEIVDRNKVYNLTMDFDEIPKRKKVLTTLRKTITSESQASAGRIAKSIKYVKSQTLFVSTLHEDVTKFDFTHASLRPLDTVEANDDLAPRVEVELELDALNKHECMASLMGVIAHMVNAGITPLPDGPTTDAPCWLTSLLDALKNPENSENTRLFVLKAICNLELYVKPFAEIAIPVLLNNILTMLTKNPINYFMMDLIVMLINWRSISASDVTVKHRLTQLVNNLIEKSDAFRSDVVKHNLEIIKTLVEVWKTNLHTQMLSKTVFQRITGSEKSEALNYINLHLASILLANKITPWQEKAEITFLERILLHVEKDSDKNKKLAAELCGMILSHLEEERSPEFENCFDKVCSKIHNLLPESNNHVARLHGVHSFYPKISSKFVSAVHTCAWTATGSFKSQSLEMLLSHASRLTQLENDNFCLSIKSFLLDMLRCNNVEAQQLSLQITEKLMDKIPEEQMKTISAEVIKLREHKHSGVRKWVYSIAIWLSDRFQDEKLQHECKVVLLKGLTDADAGLQQKCLEFWNRNKLSERAAERISYVLSELYTPETEVGFLSYAAKLILEAATMSVEYREPIFQHPISECSFQDLKLVVSWRAQHSNIAPMFAQTLASQLSRPETLSSLTSESNMNFQLRATIQSLIFQPTIASQDEGELEEKTFLADAHPGLSTSEDSLFKVPRNPLRRRFIRDNKQLSSYFAKKEVNKQIDAIEKEKNRVRKRDSHVEVYRDYRTGDYPDIQIPHKHILQLLEVLARKDPQIARQFLVSLYIGVVNYLGPQSDRLFANTDKFINTVLRNSNRFDPALLGFIFQIALQYGDKFEMESEYISAVSKASGWLSLGALLIEQNIINAEDVIEEFPKRRPGQETEEEKNWLFVAELDYMLGELDVLRGVFLDKIGAVSDVHEAIHCEATLDWLAACKCYERVLNNEGDSLQTKLYSQSYFCCLANLGKWELLNQCIRVSVDNDLDQLWADTWCVEQMLPWLLRSELITSLNSNNNNFINLIKEFSQDKSKFSTLAARFCEEMAVANYLSGKIQKSKYFIDQFYIHFLGTWSHLNQWSNHSRGQRLLQLQLISEIQQMLSLVGEKSVSRIEDKIGPIIKNWERNFPSPHNDLLVWDVKLTYRNQLLKNLDSLNVDLTEMKKSVMRSEMALAKAGLDQDNFYLARIYLNRIRDKSHMIDSYDLQLERDHLFNMSAVLKAKQSMADVSGGLAEYTKAWKLIKKKMAAQMDSDSETTRLFFFKSHLALGNLIASIIPHVEGGRASSEAMKQIAAHLGGDTEQTELACNLKTEGLGHLKNAIDIIERDEIINEKSNAYLQLALYYKKFMDVKDVSVCVNLARSLLRAMKLGNAEARQLFCCVLHLPPLVNASLQDLLDECNSVPAWMFLMWTNQLLASLDSEMFPLVKDIVLRIAVEYPNAIRYGFKLSKEKYTFKDSEMGKQTRHLVQQLGDILCNDTLHERFLKAMSYLASPYLILNYYLEKILMELRNSNVDWKRIDEVLKDLNEHAFSTDEVVTRGEVFKCVKDYESNLKSLSTTDRNVNEWKISVVKILDAVNVASKSKKSLPKRLASYSPWLKNFQSSHSLSLEIPGQYDGNAKPIVKYHVTIASFNSELTVLNSKCRPIKMVILGNDASEHSFMVKFGEDLRQDQRIQQLFAHFNHILRENKQTKNHSVDTYKVIPLSCSSGMIQWIDSTAPLQEVIVQSIDRGDDIHRAREDHVKFLSRSSPYSNKPQIAHLTGYLKVQRDEAIAQFNERVHFFPWDALRRSFWELSTSAEHFAFLRGNFAISQAVIYVTHWLLGIGDRHLQNTLISTKSGRALGIDFGYAFGFATQSLKPPELIPFRLTPQILNLMKPFNESGWIKQTMVHCLRSFRKDPAVVSAILEVFVLEPSWDWVEQAKRLSQDRGDFEPNCNWYPRRKIDMVKQKLEGANPVVGFRDDLEFGHAGHECLPKFIEVLEGVHQFNVRARMNRDNLTPEDQVACLIDLATDKHVLSKTYVGWDPWL